MNNPNKDKINKIAKNIVSKTITAMATIWGPPSHYKVQLNNKSSQKHHKQHFHINCQSKNEKGRIDIETGLPMRGDNLSAETVRWCNETLLNEENKIRVLKMLETNDFYRLDRPEEVNQHPIDDIKKASLPAIVDDNMVEQEVSYDDMTIVKAIPISSKIIRIEFKDGKIVYFNCWDEIRKPRNRKMFKEMIENPNLIYEMKIDDMGTCIYWNDKMDFMNDYIYESDL